MRIIRYKDAKVNNRDDGRTVKELVKIENAKTFEGITIYHVEVPSGRFQPHFHEKSQELIVFPLGGKVEINKQIHHLEPWDMIWLEPGDIHGYLGKGEDIIHFAIRFSTLQDRVVER